MKKTLTRILLLAAAMVLAMSLCLAHAEEPAAEEAPAASTIAYMFWQDVDWWPAVTAKEDDYWTPITATVTGEGYYTVGVQGHMPSWFYSGGNSNRGAQKLAVIVQDGSVLFPNYYMQITDIRVNGVSYPCGDVTYGQTGYDNKADDGSFFWDADDSYALLYDQWQIDNNGTMGGGTWKSTATAQKFDVFDVSVLNNPGSIEIDFFLSAQQDVKPAGGPALRVIGEGPEANTYVAEPSNVISEENSADAYIFWQDQDWWPAASAGEDQYWTPTTALVTGEGHYTVGLDAHMPGWFVDQGFTNAGAQKLSVVIDGGSTKFPGMYMHITDVRIDGVSYDVGNVTYGTTGYDNVNADDGTVFWSADDTYGVLFDHWFTDPSSSDKIGDGVIWDKEGELHNYNIFDVSNLNEPKNVEIDFFLSSEQNVVPEEQGEWIPKWTYKWYPNNTMGVAGISLRDKGITDKWYNVVPVDLTTNGIYEIPMVASNMFQIGTASVAVQDGQATVTYKTTHASAGNLVMGNECVKWFGSIEEITDEFCDAPTSEIAFGEAVDVSAFGDVGYLFICNGVTYSQPITNNGVSLPRYLPKDKVWVDYRAQLEALMAPAAEEAPVEEAPVEEAPVEEAPVEETPVEEAPVEEAPVEEAPVE